MTIAEILLAGGVVVVGLLASVLLADAITALVDAVRERGDD